MQLRLDQNSSDPIFRHPANGENAARSTAGCAGKLADRAWHVVMVEAVHYMEVDWRDSVVKPFSEQLADKYPFNPRSPQDASLDAFERFFKPGGVLDTFYAQNLKLFVEGGAEVNGDDAVVIREDVLQQLERAQNIRDIFSAGRTVWVRSLRWKPCRFPATSGAAC